MSSRRDFLKLSALAAGSLLLPRSASRAWAAPLPGGTLPPDSIAKYVAPLVIPPAMPLTSLADGVHFYDIAVRQFPQQILPSNLPPTTVWGYGSVYYPASFHYPSFTIEARYNQPVRVRWINGLMDPSGGYLPHLLPVDPTLHWANPPGGISGRDTRPSFGQTPAPYTGPVPIVTHVHGGHTREESDGYAEAWYLPAASNISTSYALVGSWYEAFRSQYESSHPETWEPGTAVFEYLNDQAATTLWYHDHTLGMTRLNVYAGPAGFYLLRGGSDDLTEGLPGPAPQLGDPPGTKYYEIPIVIQDRSFNADGSLFFPDSRAFFDEFEGPYVPNSDISPIYNPEFFGNTMVVNGRTWPLLEVEPRRYRFRLLNGCNSRVLMLKIVSDVLRPRPALPFWQIGADGGFLPKPVHLQTLLLALAERADVIVDFSHVRVGTELFLVNEGPDEPFGGGRPDDDFAAADGFTTGQVMKFKVVPLNGVDNSLPPPRLKLPSPAPLGTESNTRKLSLNELDSAVLSEVGPRVTLLGTLNADGTPNPLEWMQPVTENPALGATEVWEIHNFTADAHPIHVHALQFQVVNREDAKGRLSKPEPGETGYKDTVLVYPEGITRIKAHFDLPGLYVWHCHIIDHEDNEMMRPFRVGS
jgi:spore coat protein A